MLNAKCKSKISAPLHSSHLISNVAFEARIPRSYRVNITLRGNKTVNREIISLGGWSREINKSTKSGQTNKTEREKRSWWGSKPEDGTKVQMVVLRASEVFVGRVCSRWTKPGLLFPPVACLYAKLLANWWLWLCFTDTSSCAII